MSINAVEVAFDVDVEHEVIPPAPLTGLTHGINRRFAGPVTIGIGMKHRLQTRLQIATGNLLGDAIRNRRNAQRARAAFGMFTRSTGNGK